MSITVSHPGRDHHAPSEHASGHGDEWGEMSKVHKVAFGETMKRLAEEERAAGHEPW